MAVLNELPGVEQWLYATLSADPTLQGLIGNPARIYNAQAPTNTVYPMVVFQMLASPDVLAVGGNRVMTRSVYVVKAVDRSGSFATCKAIAKQIEALIGNKTGSTTDTSILSCVREAAFELTDTDEAGNTYRQLGGRFQIQAQAL